jgi:hypothetical protein
VTAISRRRRSWIPPAGAAVLLQACMASPAWAQAPEAEPGTTLHAARATAPITLDGRLDEPDWQAAPVADGFLQRDPDQGQPATEPTELRLLFDDHALYVGARLHDDAPDLIVRQLSRRDALAEADTFTLYLDPHRDRRTGVVLQVSAAGVQRDAAIYDDNFEDDTWDAVWESAVSVDASSWTVEMRIPFSQLRFPTTPGHAWGVNARRVVYRKNESSWLVLVPKNESGLASRMAGLEGIGGIKPGRHVELLPYVSGRAEYIAPPSAGDPFNDGSRAFGGAGLDFRYGVGTGMALVGAVNPDFGQVEVDPAVVNLTAFETFFEEKRPFFTEGSQVFLRFGRSGASEYTTYYYPEPQLFYSRRIGRAPQGRATGDYVDTPASTTILGSAKLVGRTKSGWNVGLLEAVTGREHARVATGTSRDRSPTTSWAGRSTAWAGARRSASWVRPSSATSTRPASTPCCRIEPSWGAWTATSSWTASATGSSPAGSPGARSREARPRCCACKGPRSATTSGPTPRTWASTPRRRPSRAGAGGSASTRTAATSPSTPGSGGSAPASSRTTSASPRRPTGAAPTARSSSGS